MDTRQETPFDHVAFMKDEDSWPAWPVLPVKTHIENRPRVLGVILAGHGPVVFEISMFEVTEDNLRNARVDRYESFEELHDDGWIVD